MGVAGWRPRVACVVQRNVFVWDGDRPSLTGSNRSGREGNLSGRICRVVDPEILAVVDRGELSGIVPVGQGPVVEEPDVDAGGLPVDEPDARVLANEVGGVDGRGPDGDREIGVELDRPVDVSGSAASLGDGQQGRDHQAAPGGGVEDGRNLRRVDPGRQECQAAVFGGV